MRASDSRACMYLSASIYTGCEIMLAPYESIQNIYAIKTPFAHTILGSFTLVKKNSGDPAIRV
jgi:hypothetical protein